MLLARLAVYGITVYGGFGLVGPPDDQYSQHVPLRRGQRADRRAAGVLRHRHRRRLRHQPAAWSSRPTCRSSAPTRSSRRSTRRARAGDPFAELEQARVYFPAQRGTVLVRRRASRSPRSRSSTASPSSRSRSATASSSACWAWPGWRCRDRRRRPWSRSSSPWSPASRPREGIVLVQAQLTDNSWLLAPAVRLTGGFAFAAWFAGANRGQFVLTLGGYHPDFHRDGYPVVPRLGIVWRIGSAISITGESYFALTSEALMAGLRVEIHASTRAGVGAPRLRRRRHRLLRPVLVQGHRSTPRSTPASPSTCGSPRSRSRCTSSAPARRSAGRRSAPSRRFEVGPVGLTFGIGRDRPAPPPLTWAQFVPKYLEEAAPRRGPRARGHHRRGHRAARRRGRGERRRRRPDGTAGPAVPRRRRVHCHGHVHGPARRLVAGTDDPDPRDEPHRLGRADGARTATRRRPSPCGCAAAGSPAPDRGRAGHRAPSTRSPRWSAPARGRRLPGRRLGRGAGPREPQGAGRRRHRGHRPGRARRARRDPRHPPGRAPPPAIPYRQVETGARRVNPAAAVHRGRRRRRRSSPRRRRCTTRSTACVRRRRGAHRHRRWPRCCWPARRRTQPPLDVAAWRAGLGRPVMLGSLGEGLAPWADAAAVAGVAPAARRGSGPARAPGARGAGVRHAAGPAGERRRRGRPAARGGTTVSDRLVTAAARPLGRRRTAGRAAPRATSSGRGWTRPLPARLAATSPRARRQGRTVVATGAPPVSGPGSAGGCGRAPRAAATPRRARLAARPDRGPARRHGPAARRGGRRPRAPRRRRGHRGRAGAPGCTATRAGCAPCCSARPGGSWPTRSWRPGPRWLRRWAPGRPCSSVDHRSAARTGRGAGSEASPGASAPAGSRPVPLPSASDGLLVADGCVVDVLGAVPYRGPDPARVSWASPAELLGAERGVATTLAGPPGKGVLVAVALGLTGSGTAGAAVGLRGARQVGDLLVTTDASGAGVAVAALDAEPAAPVRVTVATDPALARATSAWSPSRPTRRRSSSSVRARAPPGSPRRSPPGGSAPLTAPPTVAGPGTSFVGWEAR